MISQPTAFQNDQGNDKHVCEAMQLELQIWREALSLNDIQNKCKNKNNNMTVAVLAAGVGVCTYGSVRAGFRPAWCTEICTDAQAVWSNIYGGQCLGNTFTVDYSKVERVVYLMSGQPCPDYSRSGSHEGEFGKTGWMFVRQVSKILMVRPVVFRLEISDYVCEINRGDEIKSVIRQLSKIYNVKFTTLSVWDYGDPSHRKRVFIVGFSKELGDVADWFEFPEEIFSAEHSHCARDVAEADDKVPELYWRRCSNDKKLDYTGNNPQPGKLLKVGSAGNGIGPCQCPNAVYSWDGTFNTQTTVNGGGRRTRLDWDKSKDKVGETRLTTPVEAVRIASLPAWFETTIRDVHDTDQFVFKSVNNGIPARTATVIDEAVMRVLVAVEANVHLIMTGSNESKSYVDTDNAKRVFSAVSRQMARSDQFAMRIRKPNKRKRSSMLDTGANISLFEREVECYMRDCKGSKMQVQVANSQVMHGACDGRIRMNTDGDFADEQVTTMEGIPCELYSVQQKYFAEKYSVILSQPDFQVKCDKCDEMTGIGPSRIAKNDFSRANVEVSVPVRPDPTDGGFWIDYTLHDDDLCCVNEQIYDQHQTFAMAARVAMHGSVTEIVFGDEAEPCNIRGAKSGLKPKKQRMTAK